MYIFVLLGRFYKHLRNVYRKLPLCHMGFVGQLGAFSCFVFLRDYELDAVRSNLHYPFMGLEIFKAATRLVLFCQCLTRHRFAQSLLCWTSMT